MIQLHAFVRGKVQGVYFRDFVANHARRLGLTGFVRNLPDGFMVEVKTEGKQTDLEELLRLLSHGPPQARVERVESSWEPYTGQFRDFSITYS